MFYDMARRDGLKNYKDLDLKDAKNDDRLTKVYRDWAKKYDYDNDHVLGTVSQPKSVSLLSIGVFSIELSLPVNKFG